MKKDGFTLIEITVAVGIFSMVAVLSAATLLIMVDAQRKASALQITQDNLRFALEVMAKDIRTGRLFYCGAASDSLPPGATWPNSWIPADCNPFISPTSGKSLTFKDAQNRVATYRFNSVEKRIEKVFYDIFGALSDIEALTGPDIVIDLNFFLQGSGNSDGRQPMITISVRGSTGLPGSGTDATFNLQTTVTQRRIEFSS